MSEPGPLRLFVALTPPPEAVAELRRAVEPVRDRFPELRWTAPESWHVTVAFLGDVAPEIRPGLERRLGRVAARHPVQRVVLAHGGRFADRVLWMGVGGDVPGLQALAQGVSRASERSGVPVESRPWHGHVTLARASGRRREYTLAAPAALLADFAGAEWTAEALHLVHSTIGAGPARYQDVAAWPLEGRPGRFR
ncbi:RNA 2',3'-cyclic phosphodiesterase [Yinghuangia seranimata]|uniref:RNA 2',3'-cyclic phosphodiesterase n=1 Tax=Yinghuangia seranimata TaxID=408067 RepID=UPI00248C27E9|nr:RNA 2',3'-cyclic phosphodiesterase [Yinghuangia seranimata]MDI2125445.1 RNA 2',3'-cyclic phosphodiesterase [Yinghuangia seranimata]